MTTLLFAGVAQSEPLTAMQLDGLLSGNTLYLTIPAGNPALPNGGEVPFKYGADGASSARLSADLVLIGTWTLKVDHYCVDWNNGPKDSCTSIIKSPEGITLLDTSNGEVRGTVSRIVPGNPEGI